MTNTTPANTVPAMTSTNYNDKAQRIVALGIGNHVADHLSGAEYRIGISRYMTPAQFCTDWRVVGALLERVCEWGGFNRICQNTTEDFLCTAYRGYGNRRKIEYAVADSLREAIVDACLEALKNDTNP